MSLSTHYEETKWYICRVKVAKQLYQGAGTVGFVNSVDDAVYGLVALNFEKRLFE